MTLVSFATGNPKLTIYSGNTLPYTYGRLAGLAGSADGYTYGNYTREAFCVPRSVGSVGDWGTLASGICDHSGQDLAWAAGAWAGWGWGVSFQPTALDASELRGANTLGGAMTPNPNLNTYGFRLYIGP